MSTQDAAELISLTLSVPAIVLGIVVVLLYGIPALEGFRAAQRTREHWLIMGIVFGFIGGVLDNMYWAVPWTLEFFDSTWTTFFMMKGVYFNILSRQACGIVAAYCHIRGAIEIHKGDKGLVLLNMLLAACALSASVAAGALFIFKILE